MNISRSTVLAGGVTIAAELLQAPKSGDTAAFEDASAR